MAITSVDSQYSLDAQGTGVQIKPLRPGGLNFKRKIPVSIVEASLAGQSKTVNGPSAGIFITFSREDGQIHVTFRFPDTPTTQTSFDSDDVELELMSA